MSNDNNVVSINSKQAAQLTLDTATPVFDSTGNAMVVGDKYEMYAPTAKQARDGGFGIIWADNEGFSFTYLGVLDLGDQQHIGTLDVSFNPEVVPPEVYKAAVNITKQFGACPLCPLYVAAGAIRPVTNQ
jgi:hypothetical protein